MTNLPKHDPSRRKAVELTKTCTNEEEKYQKITAYINRYFAYDFIRATQVARKKNVPPDIDRCWRYRMGICLDLSAMAVGMLDEIGIPATLVTGTADKTYHAWVQTPYGLYDPTVGVLKTSPPKTYLATGTYGEDKDGNHA